MTMKAGAAKKQTPADLTNAYLQHCKGVSDSCKRAAAECARVVTELVNGSRWVPPTHGHLQRSVPHRAD